jgi:DNA-binding transcriptional ArsR family regulator
MSETKAGRDTGARSHPCGVEDCPEFTSEKKPFCAIHLDRIDRADSLKREIEARKEEQEAVAQAGQQGWMKVDAGGSTARDILSALAEGPQDMRSLARLASISQAIIRSYVAALKKAGLVKVSVSETTSVVEIAQG